MALAFGLGGTFAGNAMLAAIVRLVYYGLTCGALFVFRRRLAEAPGFRLPGAVVVVPIALAFCVWLLSTRTFTQAWVLGALIVLGLPFYFLRGNRGTASAPDRGQS